jgi:thiamine pyrophosphate-dependent acetolactate synthase large subunit-like protein
MIGNPSTAEAAVALLAAYGVETAFVAAGGTGSAALDLALRQGPLNIFPIAEGARGLAVAAGYAAASQTASVFIGPASAADKAARYAAAGALAGLGPVLQISVRKSAGRHGGFRRQHADPIPANAAPACAAYAVAGAGCPLSDNLAFAFRHINRQQARLFFIDLADDELSKPYHGRIRPILQPVPPAPDHGAIAEAARRLEAADRPAILLGRGSEYAVAFIDRLATWLQAPILYAQPLNPLFSHARALTCGPVLHHPAAGEFLAGCDAVLALGDVFSDMNADIYDMTISGKVVHFSADYDDFCSGNEDDLSLLTEIGAACERLIACAGRPKPADGRERASALCRAILYASDPRQVELAGRIVDALPDTATIVATPDILTLLAATARAHPGQPHRAIAVTDASSIVACAAGAALAVPGFPHVAIAAAADVIDVENDLRAAEDLAIVTPILMMDCQGTDDGFLRIPPSPTLDCPHLAISSDDDLERTLRKALAAGAPTVIEFAPAAAIRRRSREA